MSTGLSNIPWAEIAADYAAAERIRLERPENAAEKAAIVAFMERLMTAAPNPDPSN